jgi:hypothetical protein
MMEIRTVTRCPGTKAFLSPQSARNIIARNSHAQSQIVWCAVCEKFHITPPAKER